MSLQAKVTLDIGHFDGTVKVGGREVTVAFVTLRVGGGTFKGRGFAVQAPVDVGEYRATTGERMALAQAVEGLPKVMQDAVFKVWRGQKKPHDTLYHGDWRRSTHRVWISNDEAAQMLPEARLLGEIESVQARRKALAEQKARAQV